MKREPRFAYQGFALAYMGLMLVQTLLAQWRQVE
jgi:hypothetical protein